MDIHNGHRKRMMERYRKMGFDGFSPHEVLELLLFFSKPRVNTNDTAHALLEAFGSLSAVFDAPEKELRSIPGIGESSAMLIKMIPKLAGKYYEARADRKIIGTTDEIKEYLIPKFWGKNTELLLMLCFNGKNEILMLKRYESGFSSSTSASMRDLVRTGINCRAEYVIFAHNHPSGTHLPSNDDIRMTRMAKERFAKIGIELRDHLIVADNECFSMKEAGIIDKFC